MNPGRASPTSLVLAPPRSEARGLGRDHRRRHLHGAQGRPQAGPRRWRFLGASLVGHRALHPVRARHDVVPQHPLAVPAALDHRGPEGAAVRGVDRRIRGDLAVAVPDRRARASVHAPYAARRTEAGRARADDDGGDELGDRRARDRRLVPRHRARDRAGDRADDLATARQGRRLADLRRVGACERLRAARRVHRGIHDDRGVLLRTQVGASRDDRRDRQGLADARRQARGHVRAARRRAARIRTTARCPGISRRDGDLLGAQRRRYVGTRDGLRGRPRRRLVDHVPRVVRPHGHARLRDPDPRPPGHARRVPGRHLRRDVDVLPGGPS